MNSSEQPEPAVTGIRVLVVDDSTVVRRLMDLTLTPLGVVIDFADTGEGALELAKQRRYDLVFLDIMLPGIDGYRVCKGIKGDKATKHTPVVMLTSKDTAFDKVRGIMAGTDVYLTKPLERNALLAAMGKCLPRWRNALPAHGTA
ncbi:MAG: response regulator [Gammaproteobacteria bacterium]|nr:response regulator [Gammaproteobacteria bacterium]